MMSLDFLASSPCEEVDEDALVVGVSLFVERFSSSACPSRTVPWRVWCIRAMQTSTSKIESRTVELRAPVSSNPSFVSQHVRNMHATMLQPESIIAPQQNAKRVP